ncbi:MAG: hypothetical protein ABSD97_03720 [Acidimicrobiales bacterium]|jgi:hypothetical protein
MRHVPDGTLRRLVDEPFAVADRDARHVGGCGRCRARSQRIAEDAATVERFFDVRVTADTDRGLIRSRGSLVEPASSRTTWRVGPRRSWRLMGASLGTSASLAALGVVIVGVAAAATLTTVFAPTQVAKVPVSQADVQEITQLMGLNTTTSFDGFKSPSGSETLPFGMLSWTSSGGAGQVASLADAEAATGLSVTLPTTLPNGVSGIDRYAVLPKVTATIAFGASAGSGLSGSSLVVSLGPAVAVSYSGATTIDGIGPLAILTVAQPIVTSTGATTNQIENFLLSQPGVPADLAAEIRLLGNLQTTLPIPTPPGASSESTEIDGSPAVVLFDNSNAASGAIWEERNGVVHAVAGLLDKEDVLSVAQQIG